MLDLAIAFIAFLVFPALLLGQLAYASRQANKGIRKTRLAAQLLLSTFLLLAIEWLFFEALYKFDLAGEGWLIAKLVVLTVTSAIFLCINALAWITLPFIDPPAADLPSPTKRP